MDGEDDKNVADVVGMGVSEDEMSDRTQQNVQHPECSEVVDGDPIAGNREIFGGMTFHPVILPTNRLFTEVQGDAKFVEGIFIGKV